MPKPFNSFVSIFDGDITKPKGTAFTGFLSPDGRAATVDAPSRPLTGQPSSGTPRLSGSSLPSSPRAGQRKGVSGPGTLGQTQSPRPVPTPQDRLQRPTILPPTQGRRGGRRAPQTILAAPEAMLGLVPESALREQLLLAMLGGAV